MYICAYIGRGKGLLSTPKALTQSATLLCVLQIWISILLLRCRLAAQGQNQKLHSCTL